MEFVVINVSSTLASMFSGAQSWLEGLIPLVAFVVAVFLGAGAVLLIIFGLKYALNMHHGNATSGGSVGKDYAHNEMTGDSPLAQEMRDRNRVYGRFSGDPYYGPDVDGGSHMDWHEDKN